jgi:hypothetical protein
MPAPKKSMLGPIVEGLFQAAGLRGENIPDLADVVADAIAQALDKYLQMAMVQPGIPAAVDPLSGSGATSGPGRLSAPPSAAFALEPTISGLLSGKRIQGENAPDLAKAMAGIIGHGLEQFTKNVQVAPGIAIAGFTTASPGILV